MDRGRESQGSTTACSNLPERDGKNQGKGSPKQACSYWFARSSWLATVARTSILLGAWPVLYCVSLALSVSRLDFVIDFVISLCCSLRTGLLSLNSLFPSIYDIDGCATTAAYLISGWVFTVWPRAGFLRSAYVRIQFKNSIQFKIQYFNHAGNHRVSIISNFSSQSQLLKISYPSYVRAAKQCSTSPPSGEKKRSPKLETRISNTLWPVQQRISKKLTQSSKRVRIWANAKHQLNFLFVEFHSLVTVFIWHHASLCEK